MEIYLAGASLWKWTTQAKILTRQTAKNINILQSFCYRDKEVEDLIPYLRNYMLDSGAFTFFGQGKQNVNWWAYIEQYSEFIKQYNVEKFFELDIDCLVGYEKVKEMRKYIERKTGKQCIPVWHINRGKNEFINLCAEYSYVALGGIAIKEIDKSCYKYFPWFIDMAHKHNAKIHGLGFTSVEGIKKYHFDSVDSSSWTTGNRFGGTYHFNGSGIARRPLPQGVKMVQKNVAVHNFAEWVKFAKWAQTHL